MKDYFADLRAFAARLAARFRASPLPPFEDPSIGVREPRRRGPGGRSSAVAVDEPHEDVFVRVHGEDMSRAASARKR